MVRLMILQPWPRDCESPLYRTRLACADHTGDSARRICKKKPGIWQIPGFWLHYCAGNQRNSSHELTRHQLIPDAVETVDA
jgi:hypothetical protein